MATGGNILPAMVLYRNYPGMEGAIYYYWDFPKNPMNDWFVTEHRKRFGDRRTSSRQAVSRGDRPSWRQSRRPEARIPRS